MCNKNNLKDKLQKYSQCLSLGDGISGVIDSFPFTFLYFLDFNVKVLFLESWGKRNAYNLMQWQETQFHPVWIAWVGHGGSGIWVYGSLSGVENEHSFQKTLKGWRGKDSELIRPEFSSCSPRDDRKWTGWSGVGAGSYAVHWDTHGLTQRQQHPRKTSVLLPMADALDTQPGSF